MRKSRRYAAAVCVCAAAVAFLGYAVQADGPQPTGTWAARGAFGEIPRDAASALLANGRLVVAGGSASAGQPVDQIAIYDPASGTLTPTGHMSEARTGHTATALGDGRVLIAGGRTSTGVTSSFELYDPATGKSTAAGALWMSRADHAAAPLLDGRVLIVGGTDGNAALALAEMFDPATGSTAPLLTSLAIPRTKLSATTLLDGRVLVAGGSDGTADLASAEIYNPYSQSFSIASTQMSVGRQGHSAILLPNNGGVLVAGGRSNGVAQAGVDLFLPAVFPDPFSYGEGEFKATGSMTAARAGAFSGPTDAEGYAFAAAGGSADAEVYRFATIKTDKDDYAPGELAVINGSGWQPNEEVTLLFQEDPAVHDDYVHKVNADGNGHIFWNQWAPEHHDIGVRFYLTATDSRSRAQMTFTDAPKVGAVDVGAQSGTVIQGTAGNATYTVTVTRGNSQSAVQAVMSISSSLPNGVTASFSPSTVNLTKDQTSGTSTLTLTTSALSPATTPTFSFTVKAAEGSQDFATSNGTLTIQSATTPSSTTTVTCPANVTYTGDAQTPCTAVATGAGGLNQALTVSYTANVNVGTVTASASFPGDATHDPSAGSATFTINKANATVSVSGYNGTYDGAEYGATGSATGVLTEALTGLNLGAKFTNAPGGTAHWTFTGGTNYNDQSGDVAITINKADANVVVNGYTGTYDGAEHGATGSATGVLTEALTGLNLGAKFTNAPGGTAHWTFTGGTNYNDQNGDVAVDIAKADANVSVSGFSGTYDGAEHGATGSATGVLTEALTGLNLGQKFTNAPGGTAHWTFTGGQNYNDNAGDVSIAISKADAVCAITGYTGAYDATAHGAAGSCTGVDAGGAAAGSTLDLGASFTNVPGGTAHWAFTGGQNYNDDADDVSIAISKADAVCAITGYTGAYDATAHGAAGSCTGVDAGGAAAGSTLDLGASFTNVPGGTAHWAFTGGQNYNDDADDVSIAISKADAVCAITGYTGAYDATAHGAAGSCTGVDAGGAAAGSTLDLGASFTNVPGGTAHWAFTGGQNYNDDADDVSIAISKADAACTINGYTGAYDAAAHGATGSCVGVSTDSTAAGSSLRLGATYTDAPGGTADWSFTGGTNYNDQSGDVAITINKADANVVVNGYTGTYDAASHGATGTATGVGGVDLSAGLNLGASFTNVPGGTAHWTFTGGTNYNNQNSSVAIVINKASQSIMVTTPAPLTALYNTSFTIVATGGASGNPVTFNAAPQEVCKNNEATITMMSGYGTCTVMINQAGNNNYDAAEQVVETVKATAWKVTGFYSPVTPTVSGVPVWNVVKGGSTVPLKFEVFAGVNGPEQTTLSAVQAMSAQPVICGGGVALPLPADQLDNTGGTSLRYDGTQFIQNWKTPKTAGACFLVTMTAADSSTISAYFQVK